MRYPDFFDDLEKIVIKDDLAEVLGAFEEGVVEFGYLDVVKSAGHSCPTVAGAYLMIKEGLKEFSEPKRGEIEAYLKDDVSAGVTGVVGNVISQILGATKDNGFHGLAGRFDRRGLMHFNSNIESSMRLKSQKEGKVVDIYYNPNAIPPSERLSQLMQKVVGQNASKEEQAEFKKLWQKRVCEILNSPSEVVRINSFSKRD